MSPDQDGQAAGAAEASRTAARDARRQWAREVSQALQEQRLSIHAAAKAIGISPGRLQAWLSQDVEPSPRAMKDLARVIGRGHLYLLRLLEWLPEELGDAPLRLEATERLREAIANTAGWVDAANGTAGATPVSDILGPFLAAYPGWEVTVRAVRRGIRWPLHHTTEIGFIPASAGTAAKADLADKEDIERGIGAAIDRAGATWLTRDDLHEHAWAARTDLVLSIPVLTAGAARGLRPNLYVPPSIAIVGIPETGAREVAALLANALDWAHLDVRAAATARFGIAPDAPAGVVDRAQITIVQELLDQPQTVGRFTVWSCSDPRPILQTFRTLGAELPIVVLLRAPDTVLDVIARQLGADQDPEANLIEAAQNVVGRTLTATRDENTHLILDLPAQPFVAATPDADLVLDTAVEQADQVLTWLAQRHGGIRPDELPGVLGHVARSRHG